MIKNYIPTINISSLVKNNFETRSALKTIKEIEKACVKIGFQITVKELILKKLKKHAQKVINFSIYQTVRKENYLQKME